MWWWDKLIEDRIQTAHEKGLLKNLEGEGKPLKTDDGHGKEWLANHLLRQADVLPEWLQLRKDIDALRPEVVAALREYRDRAGELDPYHPGDRAILDRLEARYVAKARAINLKIDGHNLRCPSIDFELPRFREDVIARERERVGGRR